MGATAICPSAASLIHSIIAAKPELHDGLMNLAQAHSNFVVSVHNVVPKGRDLVLAVTSAEDAFSRALKGIADEVLAREGGIPGGGGKPSLPADAIHEPTEPPHSNS